MPSSANGERRTDTIRSSGRARCPVRRRACKAELKKRPELYRPFLTRSGRSVAVEASTLAELPSPPLIPEQNQRGFYARNDGRASLIGSRDWPINLLGGERRGKRLPTDLRQRILVAEVTRLWRPGK